MRFFLNNYSFASAFCIVSRPLNDAPTHTTITLMIIIILLTGGNCIWNSATSHSKPVAKRRGLSRHILSLLGPSFVYPERAEFAKLVWRPFNVVFPTTFGPLIAGRRVRDIPTSDGRFVSIWILSSSGVTVEWERGQKLNYRNNYWKANESIWLFGLTFGLRCLKKYTDYEVGFSCT